MEFTAGQIWTFIIAVFGLALTVINLFDKVVMIRRKANEPHEQLEKRVTLLEMRQKEVDQRLEKGTERFDQQDNTNEIILRSTLALIEYEIQFCYSENKPISKDLERAKDDLHDYLARK